MQNEILLVAESVSGEKELPREVIFEAIESALATATKKRYKEPSNIEVNIDKQTGDYETFRFWEVVEEQDFEDSGLHLLIEEAKKKDKKLDIGSRIEEKIKNHHGNDTLYHKNHHALHRWIYRALQFNQLYFL